MALASFAEKNSLQAVNPVKPCRRFLSPTALHSVQWEGKITASCKQQEWLLQENGTRKLCRKNSLQAVNPVKPCRRFLSPTALHSVQWEGKITASCKQQEWLLQENGTRKLCRKNSLQAVNPVKPCRRFLSPTALHSVQREGKITACDAVLGWPFQNSFDRKATYLALLFKSVGM